MNPAADACDRCIEQSINRRTWYAQAGIDKRHADLRDWSDLQSAGPAFDRTVAALRSFLNQHAPTIFALVGARGTGKSQLGAVAVVQSIRRNREARRIHTFDLMSDLKRRFNGDGDSEGAWLRDWRRPWLLVCDEFQALAGNEYSLVALNRVLDARYEACRPTIIIANCRDAPAFAELAGDRIADRCREAGGVAVCDWASFRVPK